MSYFVSTFVNTVAELVQSDLFVAFWSVIAVMLAVVFVVAFIRGWE